MNNELILQVGVKILIQNKDGQYLLLRRSVEKYPEVKGRWDIVGGRIEPGKTLIDNLKREMKEETNLHLIGTPKLIGSQDIMRKAGYHVVRLTYIGKAEGDITLDTSENDMYKWYDREELISLEDVDVYLKELIDNKSVFNQS